MVGARSDREGKRAWLHHVTGFLLKLGNPGTDPEGQRWAPLRKEFREGDRSWSRRVSCHPAAGPELRSPSFCLHNRKPHTLSPLPRDNECTRVFVTERLPLWPRVLLEEKGPSCRSVTGDVPVPLCFLLQAPPPNLRLFSLTASSDQALGCGRCGSWVQSKQISDQ